MLFWKNVPGLVFACRSNCNKLNDKLLFIKYYAKTCQSYDKKNVSFFLTILPNLHYPYRLVYFRQNSKLHIYFLTIKMQILYKDKILS